MITIDLIDLMFLAASKRFTVPRILVLKVLTGSLYDSLTNGCAAKWKIISGFD